MSQIQTALSINIKNWMFCQFSMYFKYFDLNTALDVCHYFYWSLLLTISPIWRIPSLFSTLTFPFEGNWVLERSIDGVTFEPWQYYAITDTECLTRFNINPRTGPPSYTRDDEVICTSFYSKIHPLENGEVRQWYLCRISLSSALTHKEKDGEMLEVGLLVSC